MHSEQYMQVFSGTFGAITLIVIVIWAILSFFLPFMVYSIMQSNKRLLEVNRELLLEIRGRGKTAGAKRVEPEI